jgi:hypothetical protein
MANNVSIIEFNEMTTDEKAWYLWHGATFLHVYEKPEYRINLFYLNNYYIELSYNIAGNRVDSIRAFTSIQLLNPFLENISISILTQQD